MDEEFETLLEMVKELADEHSFDHVSITYINGSLDLTAYQKDEKKMDMFKTKNSKTFSDFMK